MCSGHSRFGASDLRVVVGMVGLHVKVTGTALLSMYTSKRPYVRTTAQVPSPEAQTALPVFAIVFRAKADRFLRTFRTGARTEAVDKSGVEGGGGM